MLRRLLMDLNQVYGRKGDGKNRIDLIDLLVSMGKIR